MKRFLEWIGIKQKINEGNNPPSFDEKDVWWVYLGENVGHEEDGKGEFFLRPFIVIRKFNKELLFGIPCSSIKKNNKYYYKINIKSTNFTTYALLSQPRVLSSKRLTNFVAKLGDKQFKELKTAPVKAVIE